MRIMILGDGAREHAIAWRLGLNDPKPELYVARGNVGTAKIAKNIDIDPEDEEAVIKEARSLGAGLVVVGPEKPLAKGVANGLILSGIPVFGPTKEAARIESSKVFGITLMRSAEIPHPESHIFYDTEKALDFLGHQIIPPVVVKTDGLAGGKGVWVCKTLVEGREALRWCSVEFPDDPVIIQECLQGWEVSVFAFVDRAGNISPLVAACDYKRARDGNIGKNTGGMGSYAWPIFWNDNLEKSVLEKIIRPVVATMDHWDCPFSGLLYAGLMITADGPKVLEFNCRFGDPEAQVILPLFRGDLAETMMACSEGRLDRVTASWLRDVSSVGVVLAHKDYPDDYKTGAEITGYGLDDEMCDPRSLLFHAKTKEIISGSIRGVVTDGGRIFTAVGMHNNLLMARKIAYDRVRGICFEGEFHRKDIAIF